MTTNRNARALESAPITQLDASVRTAAYRGNTCAGVLADDRSLASCVLSHCRGMGFSIARAAQVCKNMRRAAEDVAREVCDGGSSRGGGSLWACFWDDVRWPCKSVAKRGQAADVGWIRKMYRAEMGAGAARRPGESVILSNLGLNMPAGMAFGPRGDLMICDYGNKEIVRLYRDGAKVCRQRVRVPWGHPAAIALSADGKRLAVAIQEYHVRDDISGDFLVVVLDTPEEDESGAWMCGLENAVRVGGERGAESLNLQYPNGLCFLQGLGGDKGVLAISDFNNDRIVIVGAEENLGAFSEVRHKNLLAPTSVCQLGDGRLCVVPYMHLLPRGRGATVAGSGSVLCMSPPAGGWVPGNSLDGVTTENIKLGKRGEGAMPVSCASCTRTGYLVVGDRASRNALVFETGAAMKANMTLQQHGKGGKNRRKTARVTSAGAWSYKDEDYKCLWPLGPERGGGPGDDAQWPWLGIAVCRRTGDIAVADTDFNEVVLL